MTLASGQELHQRLAKPERALHGAALSLHHNNLIAVLKPFIHSALKAELAVHGFTPSHQPSFIFSNMPFHFQKREILYSYKSRLSPLLTRRPSLPACCSTSASDLDRRVSPPHRCWQVVPHEEQSWAVQGEVKSPSATQRQRFIASPLETPMTVLPMTDCWPNNEPFVPSHYSCNLSFHQNRTLFTIFLPQEKAKSKINKHRSSFLGTGFLQLGKPGTLYRLFWYSCITAMSLQSCFGMDKSTCFAFFLTLI